MVGNLTELLAKIEEVCPLPATAQRVIELTSRADASLETVSDALEGDPALAAEVLRIANSAAFGRARQIGNLRQAVMIIGLHELHEMATAMAMLAAFRSESELGFRFHDWAVLSGNVARRLAREIGSADPGAAFLAGLLCEVGAMACLAVDAPGYLRIWQEAAGDENERLAAEAKRYSATSREIGAHLLDRNRIPEEIWRAVGTVGVAIDSPVLTRLTVFARISAPFLIQMAKRASMPDISKGLHEIGVHAGVALPGDRLVQVCIEASGQAEQTLRKSRA